MGQKGVEFSPCLAAKDSVLPYYEKQRGFSWEGLPYKLASPGVRVPVRLADQPQLKSNYPLGLAAKGGVVCDLVRKLKSP